MEFQMTTNAPAIPAISNPVGLIAWLSVAAALLSLVIAGALSLLILGFAELTAL
jgi:hypothetical protein